VEDILMTQKSRWLAALALLLAFGVGAVRAEEEQEEVAPPAHTTVGVLPAPYPAPTAAVPHSAPCCQSCPSCASSAKCCTHETPVDPTQYVVTTKIVTTNAEGDCDEITSPKVTVFEGQGASILVQGIQTPTERRDLSLQMLVTKQGKDVRLDLGVQHHVSINLGNGSDGAWAVTRKVCNVTLGKMKRLVLEKNADGSDRTWAEATVTAIPPEDDADGSALDCIGEVVDDLIETVADVATSLFGDDSEVEPVATPAPVAVAPRAYPVAAMASCPAVKQCVAVEAVKKPVRHMRIAASHGSKCVEISDGDKGWKGTADRITLRDGNLVLEGHVQMASSDGGDEITSEKLSLKVADVEILIGD
jgi:hypothetical protein